MSTHPFAWAQLVFYHRGPERPVCKADPSAARRARETVLERTFQGLGRRKVLQTGFVGRRVELHRARQRIRRGDKVFVLQGLGGLGKSTLAFRVLPMLGAREAEVAVLWCQETESRPDRAEALVAELLEYCRGRFGAGWERVVQHVDRVAGSNAAQIGDRRNEANQLASLGIAYASLGKTEKAIELFETALRIGEEIKDPQIVHIVSAALENLKPGP